MKKAPYSFAEAQMLCNEYQYLIGQPFDKSNQQPINSIVVSPFDQMSKKRFIIYYLLFNDADMALAHEYKGLLFDILVIAGANHQQELYHEDIHIWLSKNKLVFGKEMEPAMNTSFAPSHSRV